jgi:hypothetical protein
MNATEIIARLIDSKAINGEEAICLLQSTEPMKEVFSPFNQVKEFGTLGNPYSPVYPSPDAYGVLSAKIAASSITLEEKEITIDGWIARDENGMLCLFNDKPLKRDVEWTCGIRGSAMLIESTFFPKIKWEDAEPTKVKLIIEKV